MSIAMIVLAAGNGTRMKSPLPKVLHPVAGKPILGWVLDTAESVSGKLPITMVVQPDAREVKGFAVSRATLVDQAEQKGTGHAVQLAMETVPESSEFVVVLYGDHPFITSNTIYNLVDALKHKEAAVAVLGFEPDDPAMYGRLMVGGDGTLESIVEYKDADDNERSIGLCNSGVMAFRKSELAPLLEKLSDDNASGELYLTDTVKHACGSGLACAYVMAPEEEVAGINSQAERAQAEAIAQKDLRSKALAGGVMMVAPETVFFSHDTQIAPGVVIHPNVVFENGVVIEEGVEIKSFCHLKEAHVGKNATVGPYARLRPGAELAENVGIGNFVEVKKATLHEGVKVNHLSYIGDAEIGAGTNIGAGTITCNYDGVNKHQTTIGEKAFIGSNSSLVAPVTIGDGAVIGAGSTVMKDVAADALAINTMPQVEKQGRASELRKKKD